MTAPACHLPDGAQAFQGSMVGMEPADVGGKGLLANSLDPASLPSGSEL